MASVTYDRSYMPAYGQQQPQAQQQSNLVSFANRATTRQLYYTLDELTNALKADIEAGEQSSVPECTVSELSLAISAWVPLHRPNIGPYADGGEHDLPAEFKTSWTKSERNGVKLHPQASVHGIISGREHHTRQTVQRAASRGIVAAIEAVDGFKYSFNNAWGAKDDDGLRFSYICQDSTQNKDRHANGFTRTQKHLKGEGERGPRKPTFDCKGSVSVKCSLQRECIDVYYRHYAIHPKVKERQPVRKSSQNLLAGYNPPGSSQSANEETKETGGLFGKLQTEDSAFTEPPKPPAMVEVNNHQASNIGRPLKRKRDTDAPARPRDPNKALSLVELLKQSQTATSPPNPTPPKPAKTNGTTHPPPVNYDLPSWQAPPPVPVPVQRQSKPQAQAQARSSKQPPNLPPSYRPPYQPTQPPQSQAPMRYPPPTQQPQPPPPPPQNYVTRPKTYPKSQGLFTTMKPVPQEPPVAGYVPIQQVRAKASCTNCRYGKKKCNEQRPICESCMRAGRYDCVYESQQFHYPHEMQGWLGPPPPVTIAPMQHSPVPGYDQQPPQEQRAESPDPWFPKR